MATLNIHGGGCCGVRHIFGMDHTTVAEIDRHIAQVDAYPNNGGSNESGRLIEIILSSRQVGDRNPRGGTGDNWARCVRDAGGWPAVLAERGFRLVSRFENKNSGADCYIFHRVPHFKSIAPRDLPFAWEHTTTPPNQHPLAAGSPGVARPQQQNTGNFNVGDRIRYNDDGAARARRGRTGTLRRYDRAAARWYVTWDDGQYANERFSARYFTRVDEAAAPEPAPAPVRVIATFFANVYRTSGRSQSLWPTREAAAQRNANVRRIDRLEILSDGTQRWFEGV